MKSIMKKAIALVIAVAVLIVPMAVSAAVYDENAEPTALSLGNKNYTVSTANDYAIFSFTPDSEAEYTFTAKNTLIGIVSYNGMWVSVQPSTSTVSENTVTWKCTGVGQSIWLAAKSDKATLTIIVEKKEVEKEEELPWTMYQNKVTPTPFTFTGNVNDLEYVDTFDGVDDRPTLGDDGYYHFKNENGPIIYVDLNDSMMNLVDAQGYGQLKYVGYDGDKIVSKIDFYDSFAAYAANADKTTMLYPLTEDLITIYRLVGQYKGWYGADGWIGGEDEDFWMFACYYDATLLDDEEDNNSSEDTGSEDTSSDNISSDGTSSDENSSASSTPESSDNSSTSSSESTSSATENKQNDQTTSPNTGSGIAFYIIAAVFAAAFASVIALKKRSVQ